MLRGQRNEWDMHFVLDAQAALAVLATEVFDVIVSDMRMPGMDGAALLTEVRRLYPGMLRIILSGYSEQESVMRTVGPAHQFLAKPCSSQTVAEVISRGLELRRVLESESLRRLVAGLKSLPSPSDTYYALVSYLNNPMASVSGVAEIIAHDVAMTVELLKVTNSAYFSLPSRVTTPLQAVRVLGLEIVAALVLKVGVFRGFSGEAVTARLMEDINRDSMFVGRLARHFGKMEQFESRALEEAFCAGMLSSVGLLVLLDRMQGRFYRLKDALGKGQDLLQAELEVFGATHLQLGAYLLGLWGFNKAVVEAVALCGQPGLLPAERMHVAGAVHLARSLAGPSPAYGAGEGGRLKLDEAFFHSLGKTERLKRWSAEAVALR